MNILALDTSSTACSVAIQHADQIEYLHKNAPMQQAKLILPMIHELLAACSLSLDQIDAIAYGCGPGSFTGIRIASSVVQGLAYAADKPVIPISSLAALAQSAFMENQCTKMLVAVDARMEQIYWAVYEVGQTGCVELIGQEVLCKPEEIDLPEGSDWCGVGDGWEKYSENLSTRLGYQPEPLYTTQLPTAQAILQLAKLKFDKCQWIAASLATPTYLR